MKLFPEIFVFAILYTNIDLIFVASLWKRALFMDLLIGIIPQQTG